MSEYTWIDGNADGFYDVAVADLDANGVIDAAAFDTNANGVADTYLTDENGDGVLGDAIYSDVNEDNVTDAVGYDVDANGVLDYVADPSTGWQAVAIQPAPESFATIGPSTSDSPQVTLAGILQNTTDPVDRAMLANAITIMNVNDANNPWFD